MMEAHAASAVLRLVLLVQLILCACPVALGTIPVASDLIATCNPTKQTGCAAVPALGTSSSNDFTKSASGGIGGDLFTFRGGGIDRFSTGIQLSITDQSDAPTGLAAKYIFFGRIDITLQAAAGTGIVTAVRLLSDDLDEINWQWLGSDTSSVKTNFLGKGKSGTTDFVHNVAGPQSQSHVYSIDWRPQNITWSIDGTVVRTLDAKTAAATGGFPQTPMRLLFGTWVGGSSSASDLDAQTAGGRANMTKGPFNAIVQGVNLADNALGTQGATQYEYGGQTGTLDTIEILQGSGGGTSIPSQPTTSPSQATSVAASSSSPASTTKPALTSATLSTASGFTTVTTKGASPGNQGTSTSTTDETPETTSTPSSTAAPGDQGKSGNGNGTSNDQGNDQGNSPGSSLGGLNAGLVAAVAVLVVISCLCITAAVLIWRHKKRDPNWSMRESWGLARWSIPFPKGADELEGKPLPAELDSNPPVRIYELEGTEKPLPPAKENEKYRIRSGSGRSAPRDAGGGGRTASTRSRSLHELPS